MERTYQFTFSQLDAIFTAMAQGLEFRPAQEQAITPRSNGHHINNREPGTNGSEPTRAIHNPKTAAEALGVSRVSVYAAIKEGHLKAKKVGSGPRHRFEIMPEDLEAYRSRPSA